MSQVTLATNYWGAFYLTHLLLPSMNKDKASRIVFTTSLSEVHGDVDWSDLRYEARNSTSEQKIEAGY